MDFFLDFPRRMPRERTMMANSPKVERRKHQRYETDLKIDFSVTFDLETKIKFQVKDQRKGAPAPKVYNAVGHNINAEGLGFSSNLKLEKGEHLILDVFLPSVKDPIRMEGRVRWCSQVEGAPSEYRTGVKLIEVRSENVEKSIFYDQTNKIQWSIVLESVFGGFKESVLSKKKLSK